jgi:hypothetical protein
MNIAVMILFDKASNASYITVKRFSDLHAVELRLESCRRC